MNTTTEQMKSSMSFYTIAFNKGYFLVDSVMETEPVDLTTLADEGRLSPSVIAMQAELMRYGYMLDDRCLLYLSYMSEEEIISYCEHVSNYLGLAYGDGCFTSLFGDFPRTVLSMSETEMFIHQIFHYLTGGAYSPATPHCDDQELTMLHDRYNLCLRDEYRKISVITKEEFAKKYFYTILSAQQSLTPFDKDAVEYLCKHWRELGVPYATIFPEEIPFKETLCMLMDSELEWEPKTITDILRYAVYISNGDISLPKIPTSLQSGWVNKKEYQRVKATGNNYLVEYYERELRSLRDAFKFCRMTRKDRKHILSMIETLCNDTIDKHAKPGTWVVRDSIDAFEGILADMKKYIGRWVRLGEILHPGEYRNRYPRTADLFDQLRNAGQYITTYNSRINAARESGDVDTLVNIYMERPGEFARNLDQLLRNNPDFRNTTIERFKSVLPQLSVKMLYELIEHFYSRNDKRSDRFVFTKGSRTAYKLPEVSLLPDELLTTISDALTDELAVRFAAKGKLKGEKFILDESIKNLALPQNMRSTNFSPEQIARGSKIPVSTFTGIFRCYVRWTDPCGRYDLDLSTSFLDENFNTIGSLSWNSNYKFPYNGDAAVFSGDVRHRQGNCAEYIDVNVEKMKSQGVKYIVATVNDYGGEGFEAKNAWAGVMERSTMAQGGEVTWAPETITTGFKLTSKCTNIVMTVIDLENMCMYVVDEDFNGIPVMTRSTNAIATIAKRYVNSKKCFDALHIIMFNILCRNGQFETVSHDIVDKVAADKKELEDSLTYSMAMIDDRLRAIRSTEPAETYDANPTVNELRKQYNTAYNKLKELQNTHVISYYDIASDYTKLFEWMF